MKYTKNISFPEARKIIEAVEYTEMSKKYTPKTNQQGHQTYENNRTRIKPEVITQLINEMRMLIQQMKTIRRTVTENKQLSKENSTPEIHQIKRHKQNQIRRTQTPFPLK